MIPTYNCATYLRATLQGVLAQDPGPDRMQIEVVDDHSTEDDPAAVARVLGADRIAFFRQPRNLGVSGNLNSCLERSRGRLIHLLHGDDGVRGGFYTRMQQAFQARPDIGAAFCRQIFMDAAGRWLSVSALEQDASGVLDDWLIRLASEQRIMTPSMVVRREAYEHLGGFDPRLICSEDWEMWVRIAASYPIWYEVEPLALYRMHSNSNTGRHLRNADDIRYTRRAIEIFAEHLEPKISRGIVRRAKRTYALAALSTAESLLRQSDIRAATAQAREALMLSPSSRVLRRALRTLLRAGLMRAAPGRRSGR
jgi:glycosyltransferase involved in cell wall biosynthesis